MDEPSKKTAAPFGTAADIIRRDLKTIDQVQWPPQIAGLRLLF